MIASVIRRAVLVLLCALRRCCCIIFPSFLFPLDEKPSFPAVRQGKRAILFSLYYSILFILFLSCVAKGFALTANNDNHGAERRRDYHTHSKQRLEIREIRIIIKVDDVFFFIGWNIFNLLWGFVEIITVSFPLHQIPFFYHKIDVCVESCPLDVCVLVCVLGG